MKNKIISIFLGFIFLIVSTSVGNFFWEQLGRESTLYIFETSLKVLNYVHQELRDSVYLEISKGFHESLSLNLYILINSLLFALIIYSIYTLSLRINNMIDKLSKEKKDTSELSNEELEQKLNDLKKEKTALLQSVVRMKKINNSVLFFGTFILLIAYKPILENTYINNAITNYKQSLNIAAPFLTNKELLLIESKFASIQKKQDYVDLIDELKQTVARNNRSLPTFWIW